MPTTATAHPSSTPAGAILIFCVTTWRCRSDAFTNDDETDSLAACSAVTTLEVVHKVLSCRIAPEPSEGGVQCICHNPFEYLSKWFGGISPSSFVLQSRRHSVSRLDARAGSILMPKVGSGKATLHRSGGAVHSLPVDEQIHATSWHFTCCERIAANPILRCVCNMLKLL